MVQGWVGGKRLRISGEGYVPEGGFFVGDEALTTNGDADVGRLMRGALLCSDASLERRQGEEVNGWHIVGDPTEGALVVAAAKGGDW